MQHTQVRFAACAYRYLLHIAGSLQGFGVNRQLRAVLRWAAVCAEGDAWLAIAGRDTAEPVQAAVKVRAWLIRLQTCLGRLISVFVALLCVASSP